MYCKKCGNEIKENETFCTNCGTSVDEKINQTKEPIKIPLSIIIILLIITIMTFAGVFLFVLSNKNNHTSHTPAINNTDIDIAVQEETKETTTDNKSNTEVKQTSTNAYIGNVSISDMNSSSENLTDIQKEVVHYFDNNYFWFDANFAQKFPQVYKGAKIVSIAAVVKILKSDDNEFEVLLGDCGLSGYNYYEDTKIEDIPETSLFVVKGKQLDKRLVKNQTLLLYGIYNDVENKEIDGKSYMVSNVSAKEIIEHKDDNEYDYLPRSSFESIKKIAEYVFGKNIKVNKPVVGQDYNSLDETNNFYKITLDDQSNSNFKVFNMYNNKGIITYNKIHNQLSDNITKKIFLSADFQHYIVSTYDEDLKYVYIDYFDRNFDKIWSREFQYASSKAYVSPMDYTQDKLAFVIDNDLYLVDINNGENIIEPVIVGEKVKVNMMSDGMILIGDNSKDSIMKVSYDGKIIFKHNIDMKVIDTAEIQVINNRVVICLIQEDIHDYMPTSKFVVINDKNEIQTQSEAYAFPD